MAYFPNGTSGLMYQQEWCERCVNWHENEYTDVPGCCIIDLHMFHNYDQHKDPLFRDVLEHFIPSDTNGDPAKCRMFIEKPDADIPGQGKLFDD